MLEPAPQRSSVVHVPFATCGLDLYTGLELMGSDMCVMPCRRSTVKLLLYPMVTSEVIVTNAQHLQDGLHLEGRRTFGRSQSASRFPSLNDSENDCGSGPGIRETPGLPPCAIQRGPD